MEYCSALKFRKDILIPGVTQVNLELMMLSDSQAQKNKYCVIYLPEVPGGVRPTETESRMAAARGWARIGSECFMGTEFQFWR